MLAPVLVEDSDEKVIADEYGPANAVTPFQIRAFLDMAKVDRNDVFYDLGSGHGRVVRMAVSYGKVKRAVGIEYGLVRFCHARLLAKKQLSKKQLAKIDFWMQKIEDTEPVGATVVYYGLEIRLDTEKMLRKLLGGRRVRIIFRDLPLLGYAPVASALKSSTTKFFLISYPFRNKIRDRDEWAKTFLGSKATIRSTFKYFDRQLKKREIDDRAQIVDALRRDVGKSFRKLR